ncbi:hypothetical protein [Nitrosomonas sp. Nm34]|uniref:hypothetical protein n=1 Tax=Nitrosomonas sp. Nm34 TaxID=1881055 RepID=UPI0008EDB7C1|nr:hypothetical protein [Nitrosomonas sp. Nm34]SFI97807.1 hypothetical protein SAMN05428978_107210 [Nitrosomonas sp. Nm34]
MTLTYGNVEENGVGAVINPKSDIAKIQSGIAYIFSQKNKPNSDNEENNILSVGTP